MFAAQKNVVNWMRKNIIGQLWVKWASTVWALVGVVQI